MLMRKGINLSSVFEAVKGVKLGKKAAGIPWRKENIKTDFGMEGTQR